MATNGSNLEKLVLPPEQGTNGLDSHHTRSPTALSLAPSESATLSGGTGSAIAGSSKGAALEGLPEIGPLPPFGTIATGIPNVTVPAKHENRTLVLCFDGTGDHGFNFDHKKLNRRLGHQNSNIVELFSILRKDDPEKQLVYYQAGIGTYTVPQIATPLFAKISKTLDEMVAWNLDAHIMDGYEFLMQNYKAGDRICIFGFSRGAYTARCLAGMIHKVGLLPICNRQQIPFAYKMYTRCDPLGWQQSNSFKKTFSINVKIDFLGVWDTVDSVGIIPRRLPFTTSNTCVRVFRHALALDERRAKFKQNTWNRPSKQEAHLAETDRPDHEHHGNHQGHSGNSKHKQMDLERHYSEIYSTPTDVEEVWFAGCHCDVGGGSVTNGIRPNLARIPLRWMIRQTFLTETGIMFSAQGLRKLGFDLDPTTYHPILKRPPALQLPSNTYLQPIPPAEKLSLEEYDAKVKADAEAEANLSEQEIDLKDALSPVYDQLKLKLFWWILELIPMRYRYQKEDNSWTSYFIMNLGQGRHIPRQRRHGVKVHRTVQTRLEASFSDGKKYYPNANLDLDKVEWVD
ncbi:hypothetical protein D9756_009559 [Leucocoprinus leucothites]|uniref:T6SS Phospholipase effector Tle1-like catalytic domain-containing protein n=1 Tax=Leucocoprinus leucothites TaxID=201217 RepID=A0A8H5CXK4_9AGAR|nr:hypothetical protein D9756_009559 [Leucoagaricus leucothites]